MTRKEREEKREKMEIQGNREEGGRRRREKVMEKGTYGEKGRERRHGRVEERVNRRTGKGCKERGER